MEFDDVHDGPFVVLSDGYSFDYADDCEISYVSQKGQEALERQNGMNIVSGVFDVVDVEDTYTVRLSEVLKFYFDNHPDEDPMR